MVTAVYAQNGRLPSKTITLPHGPTASPAFRRLRPSGSHSATAAAATPRSAGNHAPRAGTETDVYQSQCRVEVLRKLVVWRYVQWKFLEIFLVIC